MLGVVWKTLPTPWPAECRVSECVLCRVSECIQCKASECGTLSLVWETLPALWPAHSVECQNEFYVECQDVFYAKCTNVFHWVVCERPSRLRDLRTHTFATHCRCCAQSVHTCSCMYSAECSCMRQNAVAVVCVRLKHTLTTERTCCTHTQ